MNFVAAINTHFIVQCGFAVSSHLSVFLAFPGSHCIFPFPWGVFPSAWRTPLCVSFHEALLAVNSLFFLFLTRYLFYTRCGGVCAGLESWASGGAPPAAPLPLGAQPAGCCAGQLCLSLRTISCVFSIPVLKILGYFRSFCFVTISSTPSQGAQAIWNLCFRFELQKTPFRFSEAPRPHPSASGPPREGSSLSRHQRLCRQRPTPPPFPRVPNRQAAPAMKGLWSVSGAPPELLLP